MLKHQRARCRACHRTDADRGFTLVELMVALVVTLVLITPMAAAMAVTLRSADTSTASLNSSVSRQQLGSVFASDVASVDPTGAYEGDGGSTEPRVCRTSVTEPDGVPLLTLNSTGVDADDPANPDPVITRVTYWGTGEGKSIDLVRAECETDTAGGTAFGGSLLTVADGIGATDADIASTFGGGLDDGSYCNEYSCAIDVDGRHAYTVSAQRRVYGAGR